MHILVVDDECEIVSLIKDMLEDNHVVTAVCDPVEAMKLVKSTRYDMVISDYNMPSISGDILCEESRKLNPKCFNVIITGYEEYARILDDKIDRVLTKPFSWPKFLTMIKEVASCM